MTRQANADGGTVLVGQLPERPNHPEDVILHTDYSCNFGFIQEYDKETQLRNLDFVTDIGNLNLFNLGEQAETGDLGGVVALDEKGYFVAGSNQIAPFNDVQTNSKYIDETGFNFDDKAAATANPENPFKHFPSAEDASGNVNLRNPTDVCEARGPCS